MWPSATTLIMRRSKVPCGRSNLSAVFMPITSTYTPACVEGQGIQNKMCRGVVEESGFQTSKLQDFSTIIANSAKALIDIRLRAIVGITPRKRVRRESRCFSVGDRPTRELVRSTREQLKQQWRLTKLSEPSI